jgi:hypothetical protein
MIERIGSATSNVLETATTNLASTRTELSNTNSVVADLTTKLNGKIRNELFYMTRLKEFEFLFRKPERTK